MADAPLPAEIAAVETPRWSPVILTSAAVRPSDQVRMLGDRAPARIRPAPIRFSPPAPLLVTGRRFAVVAQDGGLLPGSLYLSPDTRWPALLDSPCAILPAPDAPLLVAANAGWVNYSHWLFQNLASALVAERIAPGRLAVLTPPLDAFRADAYVLAGIARERLVPLDSGEAMLPERGIHTNLTDGGFIPAPHPLIVEALAGIGRSVPPSPAAGRRVYVARTDSPNRRMENEAALCAALSARGFDIVLPTGWPLADQIALFRDAALIVAAHGAGLTNLVFATPGRGPAVIELFQENFINLAFCKIAQIVGLDYTALVNPLREIGDGRHGSTWAVDIPLLLARLDALAI